MLLDDDLIIKLLSTLLNEQIAKQIILLYS